MLLLDTDVWIDILREYTPAILWLETVEDQTEMSGFSAMELIAGCDNKTKKCLRGFSNKKLKRPLFSMDSRSLPTSSGRGQASRE